MRYTVKGDLSILPLSIDSNSPDIVLKQLIDSSSHQCLPEVVQLNRYTNIGIQFIIHGNNVLNNQNVIIIILHNMYYSLINIMRV